MQQIVNNYLPSVILLVLYLILPHLITKGLKLNKSAYYGFVVIGYFLIKNDLNVVYTQILQVSLKQDFLIDNVFVLGLLTYMLPAIIIYLIVRNKYD